MFKVFVSEAEEMQSVLEEFLEEASDILESEGGAEGYGMERVAELIQMAKGNQD